MIFKKSCYSNLEIYHSNEEKHIGYIEMRNCILNTINELMDAKSNKIKGLEYGAGTGLLTKYLVENQDIIYDILEPDERCIKLLLKSLTTLDSDKIINTPIENYFKYNYYDLIVSAFAHDHLEDGETLALRLYQNLSNEGYYICGLELLRPYKDDYDKKNALYEWHSFVINDAVKNNNEQVVLLEKEALESGIKGIADFKVSTDVFEHDMFNVGFSLQRKNKIVSRTHDSKDGIYVYVWQKH